MKIIISYFPIENEKNETSNSTFEDLPIELQTDILARLSASSLTDYFNVKKSCKMHKDLAEDSYVYARVCVKDIPFAAWHSSNGRISLFIHQCLAYESPDALYRQAMVEYFRWNELQTALDCLNRAAMLGHYGGAYLLGVISLFNGAEYKEYGVDMLSTMKKSSCFNKSVVTYRENLIELLRNTEIQNPDVLYYRPICCDRGFHGYCNACFCDMEMSFIFNAMDRRSVRYY